MLINKRKKKIGIKKLKNPEAFIDYSQTIDDDHENLEDYNPTNKRKVLTMFDDMIVDMESNKKFNHIVTELSLRGQKLNISLVFISQSYFKLPKTVTLNVTHYCIIKFLTKNNFNK